MGLVTQLVHLVLAVLLVQVIQCCLSLPWPLSTPETLEPLQDLVIPRLLGFRSDPGDQCLLVVRTHLVDPRHRLVLLDLETLSLHEVLGSLESQQVLGLQSLLHLPLDP